MIPFSATVHTLSTGEDVVLAMLPPDWSEPFEVTYTLPSASGEALTGFAYRQPLAQLPNLRVRYKVAAMDADQGQVLRNFLATVGERRVAVALFPDMLPAEDWGTRLHLSPLNAGIAADGSVQVYENTEPSEPLRAPLLLGRLRIEDIEAHTDSVAAWQVQLEEDAARKLPIAFNGSAPALWQWNPDWGQKVRQRYASRMDFERLAPSNAAALVQGDPSGAWSQSAQLMLERDQTAPLLAFWLSKHAQVNAFEAPMWYQPGNDTAQAPHTLDGSEGRGYCHFASDSITLRWLSGDVATANVSLAQTLSTDIELPFTTWLYDVWSEYVPTEHCYLTGAACLIESAGHTWQPWPIKHSGIRQSLKPQNERVKVETAYDDVGPFEQLVRGESEAPVYVRIFEYNQGAEPSVVFLGRARKPIVEGKKLTLELAAFAGLLTRKLPRVSLSRTCNHCVFDDGCGLGMAQYQCSGNFLWQDSIGKIVLDGLSLSLALPVTETLSSDPPQVQDGHPVGRFVLNTTAGTVWRRTAKAPWYVPVDWFAGGWIEVGERFHKQARTIVRSHLLTLPDGTRQAHLQLARGIDTCGISMGDTVRFFPGCDGNLSTCRYQYANEANYLGFAHAPAYIEQKPSSGAGGAGK